MIKNFNPPPPPKKPAPVPQPVAPAPAAPPPPPTMPKLPTLQKTAIDRLLLDRTGVDKQFEVNRQKAASQETAQVQGQRDALARRAAALGGGPGGAFVKAEQNAMNESAQRLGAANMEIDAEKDAELRRMGELETQLNVQREEAQAGRDLETWKTELATTMQKYGFDSEAARWAADFKAKEDAQNFVEGQTGFENKENVRTNIISTIISLKNSGIAPENIGGILKSIGYDYESLGIDPAQITGVQGVTEKVPDAPRNTAKPKTGDQPVGKVERASDGSGMYVDETGTRYVYRNGRFQRAGV
jgi:hypothetical protein